MAIRSREDFEQAYYEWLLNIVIKYGIESPIKDAIGGMSQLAGAFSRGHARYTTGKKIVISKHALIYLRSREHGGE